MMSCVRCGLVCDAMGGMLLIIRADWRCVLLGAPRLAVLRCRVDGISSRVEVARIPRTTHGLERKSGRVVAFADLPFSLITAKLHFIMASTSNPIVCELICS